MSDLRSGHLGARAFAVPSTSKRFRRPTDAVLLTLSLVLIVVAADQAGDPGSFETAFADWLSTLPGLFDFFWEVAYDLVQVWIVAIAVFAAFRRRWRLLRDWAVSLAVTTAGVALVDWIVDDSVSNLFDGIGRVDGAVAFPPLALAAGAAAVTVANPYLVDPLRKFGRWLIGLAWLSTVILTGATPIEALGTLAIGWAAGALVHLAFGSPDATPSLDDLTTSLRSIGVEATPTTVTVRNGATTARAHTPDGREVDVQVHGRDSWDSQFFVKLWRLVFYRSGGRNVTVNRQRQVEHQAYLTLLAEREGASVVPLVAAAGDERGNALFVAERVGPGFDHTDDSITDELIAGAWLSLARLHDVGIRHGDITPDDLQVADGQVHFGGFDRAMIDWADTSRRLDEAQLLASTAVAVGPDRAIEAASAALGVEQLTEMTTFLQQAAMPPALRRALDDADLDIDDLRTAAVAHVGAEEQELQTIRRFSVGNVVMWVLLAVVAYGIVGAIQSVGLQSIVDAITEASPAILLLAFIVGQTPRFAGAFAVSKASPIPVPLGRLTLLEFAITFVNLAVPSTAARVAVNIRFFQRNGLDRTTAIAVGGLDSVAGFVAQISLILTIVGFGLGSLNLDISANAPDFTGRLLLIAVVAIAIGIAVVALVPRFRDPVVSVARTTWTRVGPLLSSPRRLISVVLANLLVQLLFSLTIYTVLRAYGQDVGFADAVLVNVTVALFAGLMPVPGGVGVTEAALTAGFVAIGVDSATAMAAALTYRLVTFYAPPLLGYFAMRSLREQRLL
ncbi:MAG TPA: lysylphosphatidylglycerol synthase transmembrane domain-containing protein [Ilumatobacteraceae bacterium]|nr:lysylphosphatidylglycerol synthase transmembrane domain-containing protein [Ilumatobacteraceae bacterium]